MSTLGIRKQSEAELGFGTRLKKDFAKNKYMYIMLIPVIAYYALFQYLPMFGTVLAFKDYNVMKGILASKWVGLKWFRMFFTDYAFFRVLKNTIVLSFENIIIGFPMPIIFALLINEINNTKFKKMVQTVTYLPHFVSMVVVCGIITIFFSKDGAVTRALGIFGVERTNMLAVPQYFRSIYISTGIWQEVGWGSIIYLSALTSIDPQQYEAARIEGAGKFSQIFNVTLPGIAPTIAIMLILKMGQIMNVGYEKILLLYSPLTYETADVISTYVYRTGVLEGTRHGYSAAVGLFNSVVNLIFILMANHISRSISDNSLW